MRLPCRRPCMSVNATMTVSMAPEPMSARSSSTVRWGGAVMSSPCRSSEQSPEQRRGGVAVLFHRGTGRDGVARQDRPDDGVVLVVGVLDVATEHRDRAEQ